MPKPAPGTLIATNALTSGMVAAYLLNGPVLNLVNSVGGAQPLGVAGSGMAYDGVTESLAFTGAGYLGLPPALSTILNGGNLGIPACTILIGYRSAESYIPIWAMGSDSSADLIPYNPDGRIYTSALLGYASTRVSFPIPGGANFANFTQVGVTGAAGGDILFYVNAVLANTVAAPAASPAIGSAGQIGRNANGDLLTGNVQCFYAWTRVLSPAELAALAADPYGPIFPPPTPPGVEVSKANLYGVVAPKPGINVSKAILYAVLGTPPILITDVTVIIKGVKRVRAPECDQFGSAPSGEPVKRAV